jgi:light-harvesting complex I chlorophyll a/b binding protein 1
MMMKSAAIISLLSASASAFAPASTQQQSSLVTLNAERSASLPFMNRPALLDGSMAGDVGFDPLGLSDIDGVGVDLYWLREAEVKHARVAMLAVAGVLQVELFGPAPGCEMCTAKNQMDAFWQFWNAHPQYIAASLIFITMIEAFSGIAATSGRESGERAPGDFGLDPLGFGKGDPAKFDRLKAQEIANGRLAMWAAAGIIVQGMTTDGSATGNLMQSLADNGF